MPAAELLPEATVCVPAREAAHYRSAVANELLIHPDSVQGLSAKRAWILEHVPVEDYLFLVDDDVRAVRFMLADPFEDITDPAHIRAITDETYRQAKALGTNLFGYFHMPDRRQVLAYRPFFCAGYVNGFAMGIIPDGQTFDSRLWSKSDYDFSLMTLFRRRFFWKDNRYCWISEQLENLGGCSTWRTIERSRQDIRLLQEKYGAAIRPVPGRPHQVSVHVRR